jgi:hypothetical protein
MNCLQATSKEGKDGGIELIQPPANSKPGDRVYFEGNEFAGECDLSRPLVTSNNGTDATPLAQLNPKKKIFETIQPGMAITQLFGSSLTWRLRIHYTRFERSGVGQSHYEECT